jgi:hypothetical protein
LQNLIVYIPTEMPTDK